MYVPKLLWLYSTFHVMEKKLGAHFKPTVGRFVCRKEEIANESRARTNDGM